jgi:hypothetical protein
MYHVDYLDPLLHQGPYSKIRVPFPSEGGLQVLPLHTWIDLPTQQFGYSPPQLGKPFHLLLEHLTCSTITW